MKRKKWENFYVMGFVEEKKLILHLLKGERSKESNQKSLSTRPNISHVFFAKKKFSDDKTGHDKSRKWAEGIREKMAQPGSLKALRDFTLKIEAYQQAALTSKDRTEIVIAARAVIDAYPSVPYSDDLFEELIRVLKKSIHYQELQA